MEQQNGNTEPKKKELKEIKIEYVFSKHLEMMKLDPRKIQPFFLKELKKTFYAGFAHLIAIQNFIISNHSQEDAGKMLDKISKQIDDYLIEATKK